jgi:hypothetical protein
MHCLQKVDPVPRADAGAQKEPLTIFSVIYRANSGPASIALSD